MEEGLAVMFGQCEHLHCGGPPSARPATASPCKAVPNAESGVMPLALVLMNDHLREFCEGPGA